MKNKHLIVIAGPTASGKTSLAIGLAQHYDAAILSCDSRQFFREMSIGTAKPTATELAAAKHYFINSLSIEEAYSIGDFERDALALLDDYFQDNDIAIMAGGSGMYIKAVCEGLDDYPEVAKGVREALNQKFEEEGLAALQAELQAKDPDYYAKVDQQNHMRLIRALEICRTTGKPFSSFQNQAKALRPFNCLKVGLRWDRAVLYDRINRRVDLMMEAGLLEEVKQLERYRNLNALQAVGYKEFFDYLDGNISLERAVELVKRNTRRYAKRQLTWFRRDEAMHWVDGGTTAEAVIPFLEKQMKPS